MSSWINKEGTYKIHFACIMINYGAYIHVKTYFFYHDVDGMLSLKGRGTGVDPSVIDSGMIDGEAVFQGRIPARSTCPALMKRRKKVYQVETERKKKKGQNALAQIHPLLARKFTIKSSPLMLETFAWRLIFRRLRRKA